MNGEEICRKLNKLKDDGASLEELLMTSVEYLHNSNERFHWTGIYELFQENILHLGPFVGEPTDHVFVGVGHGVCGSAIADKCNKNIPDVTKESNYLACSSSTKSELVVLIREKDKIFAQIDIDSHDFDAFDRDTVEQVEKVSNWLAEVYMIHENSEA